MWLTDLLRKLTKGPNVGETFRDYIGCYIYGIERADNASPEYLGAPTSLPQLEQEVRRYLEDFLSTQQDHSTPEVQAVHALLQSLPQRLQTHVGTVMNEPLIALDGASLFVRQGVRQRRKENGRFVE